MSMQPIDFETMINGLDGMIADAKKAAGMRQKRDEVEKRWKMVHHQLEAFETRLRQMVELGITPPPNVSATVEVMRKEDATLAAELGELTEELTDPVFYAKEETPTPQTPLPEIDPALRAKVGELLDEMRATDFMLSSMEPDEKRFLFDIWANRWRILAEAIGQSRIQHDRMMKAAFAVLRSAISAHDATYRIQALHRDERGDWTALLTAAQRGLDSIRERRRQREVAEQRLGELRKLLESGPYVEEAKPVIREIAKHKSLRDDLVDVCEPVKGALGDEFAYLWKDDEAGNNGAAKHLTNREIVARMLHRMLAKALIGECHGPIDKITKGFPDHDKGRAKDALDLLIKAGVVWFKSQQGGRVAIVNKFVTACEKFGSGQPLGVKVVDDWCLESP